MKKLLFLIGLLVLLAGIGSYSPQVAEDTLDSAGAKDLVWDSLRSPLVDVYEENLQDSLEMEMLAYMGMGLGVLLILLSFRGSSSEDSQGDGQLLYQQLQHINPDELGQKAEKDRAQEDQAPKVDNTRGVSMELPDLVEDEPQGPKFTLEPGAADGGAPGTSTSVGSRSFTQDRFFNPLKSLFQKPSLSGITELVNPLAKIKKKKFKCSACSHVFETVAKDNVVVCPECDMAYKI